MEKVTGIGGMFFKATDPEAVSRWYADVLGVDPPPTSYDGTVWEQEAGPTVVAPFGPDAWEGPPLGPAGWGINFRVDDLDAMVAQVRDAGVEVDVDPERYPNGRFAQLSDPEGNAIQLWQQMPPE